MAFQDPPMLHHARESQTEIFSQLCVAWGSRSTTTTSATAAAAAAATTTRRGGDL